MIFLLHIYAMTIDVVVARYNENIIWLNQLLDMEYITRIFIYNKGSEHTIPTNIIQHPKVRCQNLPNKGRESGTYLHHIIHHFNDLSDQVIFTQAHPFDQAPQFLEFLPYYEQWDPKYQQFSYIWFLEEGVPPKSVVEEKATFFNKLVMFEQEYYLDTLSPVDFQDNGIVNIQTQIRHLFDPKKGAIQNIIERYQIPIQRKTERTGVFNYGAIFAVSKQNIVKHGIAVYHRMKKFHDEFQLAPYLMERLWMMYFRADPCRRHL
jgi:hypothetical protein